MKNQKQVIHRKERKQVETFTSPDFVGREYIKAIGRRKEAVAEVRLYKNGQGKFMVNGLVLDGFFVTPETRDTVKAPLVAVGQDDKVDILALVHGGGKNGQADSCRLAIARTLVALNPLFRANLKKSGFLTRDARVKERKKYGLKRARRAPQWAKR